MHTRDELFREFLINQFANAKRANPSYSLRAFSKKLKMSPGALSQLLNRKRSFSDRSIEKICNNLLLSPKQIAEIFAVDEDTNNLMFLEQAQFEYISNWAHDAFLSLIQTNECKHDEKWIAYKLGISISEVEKIIANLIKIKLIERENGYFKVKSASTQIHVDKNTTKALKKLQFDANSLSRIALNSESVEKRFHGINTLSIDPAKIDEAKAFIREFRRRFCKDMDWKGQKARIYQLNVSLYPLDLEAK